MFGGEPSLAMAGADGMEVGEIGAEDRIIYGRSEAGELRFCGGSSIGMWGRCRDDCGGVPAAQISILLAGEA